MGRQVFRLLREQTMRPPEETAPHPRLVGALAATAAGRVSCPCRFVRACSFVRAAIPNLARLPKPLRRPAASASERGPSHASHLAPSAPRLPLRPGPVYNDASHVFATSRA